MPSQTPQYRSTPLFGGSIEADLPTTYKDVSTLRQVPDNQEVYIDPDGYTSITIDILERVDKPSTNEEALKFHFEDIVDSKDVVHIVSTGGAKVDHLSNVPACKLSAIVIPSQAPRPEPGSAATVAVAAGRNKPVVDFTGILLLLVRLEDQKTDLVISLNVPYVQGEYDSKDVNIGEGHYGKLLDMATIYQERIMETFEVKDWSLFVQEE